MNILKILDKALKNNGFTEKRTYVVNSYYKLYRANLGEEKYIFAICDGSARFLLPDIISINIEAKKVDCNKVIIINQMKTLYSANLQSKIKEYGMELWDLDKLITMSEENKTRNTKKSKNKSKVYYDSDEPIKYNSKKKSNNKKKIILLILGSILVLFTPILLAFILSLIFQSADVYLLTGLSFLIVGSIFIIIVPTILFMLISKKGNRINELKSFCIKYKIMAMIIVSIIVILETAVGGGGYIYLKDIQEGPQKAIMTDAVVQRQYIVKNSSRTYIIGNVDGEVIKLELTRDAKSKVKINSSYKKIKIEYYKNIEEVYDIDVIE